MKYADHDYTPVTSFLGLGSFSDRKAQINLRFLKNLINGNNDSLSLIASNPYHSTRCSDPFYVHY